MEDTRCRGRSVRGGAHRSTRGRVRSPEGEELQRGVKKFHLCGLWGGGTRFAGCRKLVGWLRSLLIILVCEGMIATSLHPAVDGRGRAC